MRAAIECETPAAFSLSMCSTALLGGMPVVGWKSGDRLGEEYSAKGDGCEKRKYQLLHDALREGNRSKPTKVPIDEN
jgi:hypothetical protein